MNNQKVIVLNVFFGSLPPWNPIFISSCVNNKTIDFLFFTDAVIPVDDQLNVKFRNLSIAGFNVLKNSKIGSSPDLVQPYKLCDYKPLFGKIFEEYISDYQYWGYCDNDLIFGDIQTKISKVLTPDIDIVSFYGGYLSGPFCLFKNTEQVRNLFSKGNIHTNMLKQANYLGFDENISQSLVKPTCFYWLLTVGRYLVATQMKGILNWKEYKYQFQWFYKRIWNTRRRILDMTDQVYFFHNKGVLKASFNEWIQSDRKFKRLGKRAWSIKFSSGKLINQNSGEEIAIFHFVDLKGTLRHKEYLNSDTFILSEDGFRATE